MRHGRVSRQFAEHRQGRQRPEEHPRIDIGGLEGCNQHVPRDPQLAVKDDGGHPVTVACVFGLRVHGQARQQGQRLGIVGEDRALAFDQLVDTFNLRATDGRLQVAHFVFEAQEIRPELFAAARYPAMVGQGQYPVIQGLVRRHEDPAFAGGHGLGAVKGKRTERAQ
ncbi:hypothetical protein D3C81_1614100 [compost metagenome]